MSSANPVVRSTSHCDVFTKCPNFGGWAHLARLERLAQLQRQYHRAHQWRLSEGGLYVPHAYTDMTPDSLSHWDDVGFILNRRRVIVWWQHPRYVYSNALENKAWQKVGDGPRDDWLFEGGTKNYKQVGRSRKKPVSYRSREPSAEQTRHYDLLNQTIARLSSEGIDLDVQASWKWERLKWAMGVSLVAPLEVRDEKELAAVATLARRLILGQTSLAAEFADYRYSRANWLSEQKLAMAT